MVGSHQDAGLNPLEAVRFLRRGEIADARLVTPTPAPEVDEGLAARLPATALPYIEATGKVEQLSSGDEASSRLRDIICSFDWPQGCDYWIRLAGCESSLQSSVVGYGGAYVGLYQVWLGHGYTYTWLLDPFNNTLAAWELSREGTYTGAWPHCQYQ